jgi:hypothetical protein
MCDRVAASNHLKPVKFSRNCCFFNLSDLKLCVPGCIGGKHAHTEALLFIDIWTWINRFGFDIRLTSRPSKYQPYCAWRGAVAHPQTVRGRVGWIIARITKKDAKLCVMGCSHAPLRDDRYGGLPVFVSGRCSDRFVGHEHPASRPYLRLL